jgi:hypothetical protein
MYDTPSDWKISLLRWIVWFILCVGIAFEIFIVRDVALAVVNRVLAEQAILQQDAGQSVEIGRIESFITLGQLIFSLIVGLGAVSLTVILDYYLRAGEKTGRLFRRMGLAAGIELGVYALAVLIHMVI